MCCCPPIHVSLTLRSRTQENGYLHLTNIASSVPTATQPQKWAKTVIKGQGDPGYSLTAGEPLALCFSAR